MQVLGTIICKADEFNCAKGVPSCIPKNWVCDGEQECLDGRDEEMDLCGENIYLYNYVKNLLTLCYVLGNWSCSEKQFSCGSGIPKCISPAQFCNDFNDCSDGKDELCGEMRKVFPCICKN